MPMTDHDVDLDDESSSIIATHGAFRLSACGAIATGSPSFGEWEAAFKWCKAVQDASPWWTPTFSFSAKQVRRAVPRGFGCDRLRGKDAPKHHVGVAKRFAVTTS